MAKHEAAHHGRRDALLLVDTDHAAGLCGDLESFRLEDRLAAHQAQQLVLFVAYRIDRIMAGKRKLHGFGHGHAGPGRNTNTSRSMKSESCASRSANNRSRIVTRPRSLQSESVT